MLGIASCWHVGCSVDGAIGPWTPRLGLRQLGFLRLLWAAETASANSRKPYPAYHLDADGKERSVGYALKRLRDWQARWSSAVLDDPEAKTFEEFLDSVSRRRLKR